jgi:hypothetical protein
MGGYHPVNSRGINGSSVMMGAKATFMKVSLNVVKNAVNAATVTISFKLLCVGVCSVGCMVQPLSMVLF